MFELFNILLHDRNDLNLSIFINFYKNKGEFCDRTLNDLDKLKEKLEENQVSEYLSESDFFFIKD